MELTEIAVRHVFAPSLVPVERAIDVEHLSRMTLGDRELETEVLGLFLRQIDIMRPRIEAAVPEIAAAAAHTLKGSAGGIGAWALARAAAEIEVCAKAGGSGLADAVHDLDQALVQVQGEISEIVLAGAN